MKNIILAPMLVLLALKIAGQTPEWVDEDVREIRFPKSDFLTGYAFLILERKDDINLALRDVESLARTDLAATINVTVQSVITNWKNENSRAGRNHRKEIDLVTRFESKDILKIEVSHVKNQAVFANSSLSKLI